MSEFYLVNPIIGGSLKTKFKADNFLDAANKAYTSLSDNFSNNIPEFYFTLQKAGSENTLGKGKNSDYKHFIVKETKKNNAVNYRIVEHSAKTKPAINKKFKEQVSKYNKKNQTGGKKHKDKKISYDDHDDEDDEDLFDDEDMYFPRMSSSYVYSSPISYYYYDPYIYNIKNYYVPTFVAPLTPYIGLPLTTEVTIERD